jgi:regulator of protease activity HflC (stomatin/prohibitin superfamily)
MLKVVLGVVLLVVAVMLLLASFAGDEEIARHRGKLRIGAALSLLFLLLLASAVTVPAGYRGVALRFGAVTGVVGEGLHFVVPGMQRVVLMDVRTQKAEAKASAASKDLQVVQADISTNYHVEPSQVGELYKTVGLEYEQRVIQPAVQETLKGVLAKYTASQLIQLRERVKAQVDNELSNRLADYNIIVEPNGVSLTNFDFSEEFNAAIEQKQVAQQSAEKSRYVLAQARIDAQASITKAKGEAESNRVKARALNGQGGQKVLAREWIEKWNGELPKVAGGNGSNIISLDSLLKQSAPAEAEKQP